MITLALAQMVYFVCLQAPFTGGENGLQGVPRGKLFGLLPLRSRPRRCTTWCWRSSSPCSSLILRIVHSPFGQVLKAIRENEPRAISLGYESTATSCWPSCCRRRWPGLAGSLKTLVLGFATLSDVHWSISGEVILMTLLGGIGTFFGPVLGAGIVVDAAGHAGRQGRRLGHGHHRRDLRRLRAGVPHAASSAS